MEEVHLESGAGTISGKLLLDQLRALAVVPAPQELCKEGNDNLLEKQVGCKYMRKAYGPSNPRWETVKRTIFKSTNISMSA